MLLHIYHLYFTGFSYRAVCDESGSECIRSWCGRHC